MRRARYLIGIGLAAVLLTACATTGPAGSASVIGSGNVISEARAVRDFTEVQLAGVGTLLIAPGDAESLIIEAEDNLLPKIKTDVRGGRLIIGPEQDWLGGFRPTKPITYRVTVRKLNALDLSGAGAVEAANITTDRLTLGISGAGSAKLEGLTADVFSATLSGSGSLTGSGRVRQESVSISGAGSYQGEALQATTATVTVSGIGGATVRVSDKLNVLISGAGSVSYIGDPAVSQRISGLGSVGRARAE
jgi:hypothetical protein